MTKRTAAILIFAMVLAIGLAIWFGGRGSPGSDPANDGPASERGDPANASNVDVDGLQALATSSCQCERAGGPKESCWSGYRSAIARFAVAETVSLCTPISVALDCIGSGPEEKCIVTSYGIPEVCTNEEAQAVQAAWSKAFDGALSGRRRSDEEALEAAYQAANSALKGIVSRIKQGEVVAASNSSGGCGD